MLRSLFAAILGFSCAAIWQIEIPTRKLASTGRVNDYDSLPCLPKGEFEAWRVKLSLPAGNGCEDPILSKISKLIALSQLIEPEMPSDFAPEIQGDLKNPFQHLLRYSKRLGIDLSQTTTVAYNTVDQGGRSVFLGGHFLQDLPLSALITLMHEARHSSPNDSRHEICRLGNIPLAQGGCDGIFSLKEEDAGAYSFGAAYGAALSLYGKNLNAEDREYLAAESLFEIGTRFNELPLDLAQRFDLLWTLRDGTVWAHHPFLLSPHPLPFQPENPEDPFEKLEFLVTTNGALAFTKSSFVFSLELDGKRKRAFEKHLPEDLPIYAWNRIRIPYDDYPYNSFLLSGNLLKNLKFQEKTQSFALEDYPLHQHASSPNLEIPQFRSFFMGMGLETYFLSQENKLYRGAKFGNDPAFRWESLGNPSRLWQMGTGGILSDGLHLIDQEGQLFEGFKEYADTGIDGFDPAATYKVRNGSFSMAGPLQKIQEGLHSRAVLTKKGEVWVQQFQSSDAQLLSLPFPVQDLVIVRQHRAPFFRKKDLTAFARACAVDSPLEDPWFGEGMGLDRNGFFQVGVKKEGKLVCLRRSNQSYRSAQLKWMAPKKDGSAYYWSIPFLELDGEKKQLFEP
jgi:hypothetical protein